MFLRKSGGVKTHLKKAMGLSIASIFIVGGSIVPAFADAASRNIPIPNVEYTTEDWYVKENAHLIKNKDVSDLRNIVEFTVDTSQGIDKDTGRVWDDDDALGEKYVYAKGSRKTSNIYGSMFYATNGYSAKFPKLFIDRDSKRYVDMIVKGDTTNLNAVGYEPFTRDNSPLLSVTKTDILFNGLRAQHTGTITVELRYNDNGSLYDKDTMMRFVDLDTASEEVKMDNSFDGKYYVPGISPSDWWLKKNADGWIGNSTTNADNETFKTGFAFFVHNGKITFQAKANSAGFCIAANGVDNMYGSLRIIKESD